MIEARDQGALWRDALENVAFAMISAFNRADPVKVEGPKYDPGAVMKSMLDITTSLGSNPAALLEAQGRAMKQWSDMWRSAWFPEDDAEPIVATARGDRRFADKEWEENAAFRALKQSYLLAGNQLRELAASAKGVDPKALAMTNFLIEQYLNAIAPTNFALTNPEVLRRTVETGGANLASGFANFISDLSAGRGIVQRRAAGTFEFGVTIAATPGSVIFQNDLMQVIQYDPATEDVAKRPLLYIPPLVNKYYLIDLQPKASLVRWLVEQGHTVFVVSWVDPDESHRDNEVDDYIEHGVLAAMDVVSRATGEAVIDLFGFCMGGTLVAITLAYLAAKEEGHRVGCATLIASLVDFGDMREWSAFAHEDHIDALDGHIARKGYIDKDELQQLFSLVRSNDLIWSSFVNHYLLDREAPVSDILFWFEDGAHIPEAFLKSYNRVYLIENRLSKPGAATVLGMPLDMSQVETAVMAIALKDDHVSAWESVYQGLKLFGGAKRFVLGGSGHNAGVINPPAANKHGFWTNEALAKTATLWLENAEKHPGSWWPNWTKWCADQGDGERVPARAVGSGALSVLEQAPGSFITGSG